MPEIITLYTQTIIAILGFIAPVVTLLLPVLEGRITQVKMRITEQERRSEVLKESLQNEYAAAAGEIKQEILKGLFRNVVEQQVQKVSSTWTKSINGLKKELDFLNLKKQVRLIFSFLFLSLFFMIAFHFGKTAYCSLFIGESIKNYFFAFTFLTSLSCFSLAVLKLWMLSSLVLDHISSPNYPIVPPLYTIQNKSV